MTTTSPTSESDLTIQVQGMTCAACSARIQRVLERTPGVSAANVNLMTGSATVSYDPSSVTPHRLVEAIRDTGYGAELPAPDASAEALVDAQDAARDDEIRDLRRKLILSLVSAVLAMVFSMPLQELVGHGVADPLTPLMMSLTDLLRRVAPWVDGVSADTWRWLLLALTAPVVGWAGRHGPRSGTTAPT
jgi:P-type Cu+ transporter